MCPKIDVMERECKNLEFGSDLNKAQVAPELIFSGFKTFALENQWKKTQVNRLQSQLFIHYNTRKATTYVTQLCALYGKVSKVRSYSHVSNSHTLCVRNNP
jgi:hypothetical protein